MADAVTSWSTLTAQLARASTARGREALGASIAEGWRLLERALAAGVVPIAVLVGEAVVARADGDEARVLAKLRAAGVPCVIAPARIVAEHTGGRTFGDLVGLVPMSSPGLADFFSLISTAQPAESRSLLVGLHVLDPGNIGALTRTAHALGAAGALWLGGTDPRHPKALRASMGSCFRLPWAHSRAPPLTVIMALRQAGWQSWATVARGGEVLPSNLVGRPAIWMGGEAHGLPAEVAAACERSVRIPMATGVDSLSINAAAAVVLSRVH